MDDPLAGLSPRQRRTHERKAARHFATYDPVTRTGWLAEELAAERLIILERFDLDHPARSPNVHRVECIDCTADLQCHAPPGAPATKAPICLACAYRRALADC